MVIVRGRLTPEVGSAFRRALDAAVAADGGAAGTAGAGGAGRTDAVGVERSLGQRQADALGRLAECALAGGLDRGTAGDRYQVVLHVDAETLADDAAADGHEHDADGGSARGGVPVGTPGRAAASSRTVAENAAAADAAAACSGGGGVRRERGGR